MNTEIQNYLREIGMSEAEAKTYLRVLSCGKSTAGELSKGLGYSRPKIYEALDKLTSRGLLQIRYCRPRLYSALDPGMAIEKYIDSKAKEMQNVSKKITPHLDKLYSEKQGIVEEETEVWISKGAQSYFIKLRELIEKVNKEVFIMTGFFLENEFATLIEAAKELKKKDIAMKIITPHEIQPAEKKELMEYFDTRSFKMFVPIKDIYIDSSELFISIPTIHDGNITDVTSIYIGNKAWVESFKSFYDVIWKMNE